MTIGPLEAQLLASSVFAIPAIGLLLYAVWCGQFTRQEGARYVVFTAQDKDEDFWDEEWSRRHGRALRPKGRPRPRKGGD